MISFGLDEDQQLVQETVRAFARAELRPNLRAWEKAGEVSVAARRKFTELGLALLDLPEAIGGGGASALTAAIVHEELAAGDAGAAVALWSPSLAGIAIRELCAASQARRLLEALAGPEALGAMAWSEKAAVGGTLPLAGFSTVAERDGEGWRLRGKKAFVVNGGRAALTIVFAQVAGEAAGWDGIGAFAVAGGAAGLSAGPRHKLLGLETVYAGELVLDGVRAERLVCADFAGGVQRLFARAALVAAARQVGLARASYEYALEYTQDRKAFGKPVAHFQSIAFTLAEMHMDVEAARWLLWHACTVVERGDFASPLVAEASVHATEAAWRVADNAVQLLGGAGFIQDFPVEKWMRDTKSLALFGLPTELAQQRIAELELGLAVAEPLPTSAIQPIFT